MTCTLIFSCHQEPKHNTAVSTPPIPLLSTKQARDIFPSLVMPDKSAENDPFWDVALMPQSSERFVLRDGDISDDESTSDGPVQRYRLPTPGDNPTFLLLRPLTSTDGDLWSPLGAHAWYGSALWSCYATSSQIDQPNDSPLTRLLTQRRSITALELGSGAVGLAGIVLAWKLAQNSTQTTTEYSTTLCICQQKSRVILSDCETKLVRQLQRNVRANSHVFEPNVDCTVVQLDWNDVGDAELPLDNQPLDLIFGSELVYTPNTATACRDCIVHLTQQYPNALVCIVQIVDRPGWLDIFVPGLQQQGLHVRQATVDAEVDALAQQLLPRGGSLDRFAFGILYASRNESLVEES